MRARRPRRPTAAGEMDASPGQRPRRRGLGQKQHRNRRRQRSSIGMHKLSSEGRSGRWEEGHVDRVVAASAALSVRVGHCQPEVGIGPMLLPVEFPISLLLDRSRTGGGPGGNSPPILPPTTVAQYYKDSVIPCMSNAYNICMIVLHNAGTPMHALLDYMHVGHMLPMLVLL